MTNTFGGNLLDAKAAGRKKKRGRKGPPFLRGAAILLLTLLMGSIGAYGYLGSAAKDRIAKGVSVTSLDMGGRTANEARRLLRERIAAMRLTFVAPVGTATLAPNDARAKPEYRFAAFKVEDAVAGAYAIGRQNGGIAPVASLLRATLFGQDIPLPVSVDRAALRRVLEDRFAGKMRPAKDAELVIALDPGSNDPKVTVSPEGDGWQVDYDRVALETEDRLRMLADAPIRVPMKKTGAKLTTADVAPLAAGVDAAIARAPLTLVAREKTWTVSKKMLADWLTAVPARNGGAKARLAIDPEQVRRFIEAGGPALATEPKDAVFVEKGGKVVTFEPSIPGVTIDLEGSYTRIEKAVFPADDGSDKPTVNGSAIELPMTEVPPKTDTEASNPYGIKEVIGVGATNFRGSPKNRQHNIAVGAKSVDGALIAPNEEFSLLRTLGKIDASTGYLEELVIKKNKTTPEFGGGLCQIGSTAFRAALDSGLPITVRQNHSYRVPYYERDGDGNSIGPGKDATIYNPSPDFRFANDTGHEILITTAIKGNKLTFTFWGVKDGRAAAQTKARVFNVVPPPEKKTVLTTDLKPGEEKCTEHAHPGSDAVFTYTVTYADSTVKTRDFKSHYKPWQEVCLEGVDPSKMPQSAAPNGAPPTVASADAAGATGN